MRLEILIQEVIKELKVKDQETTKTYYISKSKEYKETLKKRLEAIRGAIVALETYKLHISPF